jgi:hypothetical protein
VKRHLIPLTVVILWLFSTSLTPFAPAASAQGGDDWTWMSPDVDGDGLPNEVEITGWCNVVGCFQTNPLDADSDDDGLRDGEENLFDTNPTSDTSPGIYVIYDGNFKTKEYYPWQQYGPKLIARGDDFDPPNPDIIDVEHGLGTNLDAVVVRRGTTFYVGGPLGATLQISKSKSSLTTLSKVWDLYSGTWRVTVPSNGTVGKYTLTLGDKSLDLFVIFELPTPSGDLTQAGIEKFLYDDDPNQVSDESSILLYTYRYPGDPPDGVSPPYTIPSGEEIKQGHAYRFSNEQYNRYLLEDYVIGTINGQTSQKAATDALAQKVDQETVFRNPRPLTYSWRVLHPGSNPRQQCSNISGLLAAFSRTAGIPARPIMIDWRHSTFDHSDEVWLNGAWRVYRSYKTYEMDPYPDNTHTGCTGSQWPQCGSYRYYSRYTWGKERYKPWHSGGGGPGNVMILANENWTSTGLAYRWASWDIDSIKLNKNRLMTQNTEYWRYWGWTHEPTNTGVPGWPSRIIGMDTSGMSVTSDGVTGPGLQSSEVQLGDVVAEYGLDLNGNGQYDQLVLEIEVTATRAGKYWFLADLSLDASQPQAPSQSNFMLGTGGIVANALTATDLAQGSQIVKLIFGGPSISLKRGNGPYVLSGLWVTDVEEPGPEDFMNNNLAYRGDVYTTAPYQATDFETYGAMLSGNYSYHDLDSDGDRQADGLEVKTDITVYQPGTYTVEASLYDSQDAFIAHSVWTGTGPEVTLHFDNIKGTFGPYTLRDLDLLNAQGQSIDYIPEATTIKPIPALVSPDHASFDILPAGADLIAQGITITPTQVFADSLVDGNLRIEAEVQVAEAGSYKLEAWLADTDGNLVTWAVGQPTNLTVGTQVLSLTFEGSAIRARGIKGPYQVVALKVLDGNADYAVLDKVDVALTTQAYTLDQFAAAAVAFEDFAEEGDDNWSSGSGWAISQGASFSPSHAWYGTDTNASLALVSPIDLSGVAHVGMRFQTSYKLGAEGDTGYVEASTDGVNWDILATFSGDATWSTQILDLSQYDGESAVYLRFRMASAGGAPDDGWYIDDVLVTGLLDSDDDGLADTDEEIIYGTDPNNPDSDADGLSDGDEVNIHHTDPNNPDSDSDGLSDGDEVNIHHTDPDNPDTDGDGMPDGWEVNNGLDPLVDDTDGDLDGDGLTNGEEYQSGADPNNPDTDGDGLPDGEDPVPAPKNTIHLPIILR